MPMTVKTEVATRFDLSKLIDELNLKVGVELGVDSGFFSNYLLENTKLEKLYSVDAWEEGTESTMAAPRKKWTIQKGEVAIAEDNARRILGRHGNRSTIIKGLSFDAADWVGDNQIDFIMFDAGHRFSGFALDVIRWWPKIKMGGVIAFHDYWRRYRYEVMDVANAFCVEHRLLTRLTWADKSKEGRSFAPPTLWTIKEDMTKNEYFKALPETYAALVKAKQHLAENGVRVVLPYQYRDSEDVDNE